MSIIGERLKWLREQSGKTQAEVANALQLNHPNTISRYETGERKVEPEFLVKFARYYNTSTDFITGLRQYDKPWKRKYKFKRNLSPSFPITCISSEGSIHNCFDSSLLHHCNFDSSFIYFKVADNSMIGDGILSGDITLIKQNSKINYGDIAIVLIDKKEYIIRRLYKKENSIILQSSNPSYPLKIFQNEETQHIEIIGKVIELKRTY